ncbi:MAG: hypothetical protein GX951_04915 [Mollicutes bacterium]|nr:hypothetical protein [Mollicutes bacterium]
MQIKKIIIIFIFLFTINVNAKEAVEVEYTLKVNEKVFNTLSDNNYKTYLGIENGEVINIKSDEKIEKLYILYEEKSSQGIITFNETTLDIGINGFLHEYIELKKEATDITIKYNNEVKISEIYAYSSGDVPKDVQIWKKHDKVDLMLFSTHSDDEQLFFAGLLPTYVNQDKIVHVVYLVDHANIKGIKNASRLHEQLNGLWHSGVNEYPTMGLIPDAYSESLQVAKKQAEDWGYKEEDILKEYVTIIRRLRPYVLVGHDEAGEYGHGQHIYNSYLVKKVLDYINNDNYITEGYKPYNVQKVYLHLYEDNKIILDIDKPLDKFNNKTAYDVAKESYKYHISQQGTWFTAWLNGNNNSYTNSSQITKYNPNYFGLYYTSVGNDINKNDLLENVKFITNDVTITGNTENIHIKRGTKEFRIVVSVSLVLIFISIVLLTKFVRRKK